MSATRSAPVDVVIPVFNAPELTRRCIDSIYASVGPQIREVFVHDNASERPTASLLDSLDYPGLRVHHAAENTGFGDGVNQAVNRTSTPLVLVLNSDVEAHDDFLSPLVRAMDSDERLAAVTPAGNQFDGWNLSRYARRVGCIVTYSLAGYAFLVRRQAFLEVGGFDPVFGLGFYEDADLTRRWVSKSWWLGVHPDTELHHEVHGSFQEIPGFPGVLGEQNREIYFERYPGAHRQVLLVTREPDYGSLPAGLRADVEQILEGGGGVYWIGADRPRALPALQVRPGDPGLLGALLQFRRRRRAHKPLTDCWIARDAPRSVAVSLASLSRRASLPIRRF